MPSAAHARTSRKPGSETVGMPPSVTSATVAPSRSRRSISSVRSRSFPSKNERSGRSTRSRCVRRRPVRRVSSAAIRSTAASVSTARGARSPRLPIGVPTRKSVPVTTRWWQDVPSPATRATSSAGAPWRTTTRTTPGHRSRRSSVSARVRASSSSTRRMDSTELLTPMPDGRGTPDEARGATRRRRAVRHRAAPS